MKLPAVAIAVAFASGILLGLSSRIRPQATHDFFLECVAVCVVALLIAGAVAIWREWVWAGAAVSLFAWLALGLLAGCLTEQPLPAEHILSRIAAGEIPKKTALRWHGMLRNEPARLPWGWGLDLDLTGVEVADSYLAVRGGMRAGFTPKEDDLGLPDIHAGDEISMLAEARLPLTYKDPGAFDRREFLARQDIHVQAMLRASKLLEKTGTAAETNWAYRVARLRGELRRRVDEMFPSTPQVAGILRAVLLGDRSFVDRAESQDFQKTGVFHVLVVAGLHVAALVMFLVWVARKLRMAQMVRMVFVLCALFAYVAVVEQRAPVLRAALMAAVVVLGGCFYRRLELLNSAALAALLLLVVKPWYATDTGFLLSFVAIGAIAGVALPLLQRKLQPLAFALENWRDVSGDASHAPEFVQFRLDFRDTMQALTCGMKERYAKWMQEACSQGARLGVRVAELFVLSVILQFGMLPLMARDFHRVSLLGPLANLFAVPLTGVIVPYGFASLGLASVAPRVAAALAHPLIWLVVAEQRIVAVLAGIPHGSYRIPGPPEGVTACFFALGIALVFLLRDTAGRLRWPLRTVVVLLVGTAVVVAVYPFRPAVSANELEISVLDVAQGDAILVVSPKGSTLLIDGGGAYEGFRGREEHWGPDPGEEAVSAYLWSRGFQKLAAVALTHAHQDHIGGLTAVLQNFRVGRLLLGRETAAPAFARLKQLAGKLNVPIEREQRMGHFQWDGVRVDVLWPEMAPEEVAPQAKNNDSLVMRLQYGERTILLPGDAEKQVEYKMLSENDAAFLHADVLKVGHHGSKNSTMPEFLSAVAPQISVISAGEENPYGHPSPELLDRLQENGTRTFRTDQDGEVQVLTDGRTLRVNCFIDCSQRATVLAETQAPNHKENKQQ